MSRCSNMDRFSSSLRAMRKVIEKPEGAGPSWTQPSGREPILSLTSKSPAEAPGWTAAARRYKDARIDHAILVFKAKQAFMRQAVRTKKSVLVFKSWQRSLLVTLESRLPGKHSG